MKKTIKGLDDLELLIKYVNANDGIVMGEAHAMTKEGRKYNTIEAKISNSINKNKNLILKK